jgi:hypothetical protein
VARQRETQTEICKIEPQFARNPAQVRNGIINYGTSEGIKLFSAAIAPLTTKYTGEMTGLHIFLKDVRKQAQLFNWQHIISIPVWIEAGTNVMRDLIDQYGLIKLSEIKDHALTYELGNNRKAQDSAQMYNFLYDLLTTEAKMMVLPDVDEYTIEDNNGRQIPNGPMFLKVIIRNTVIDTQATVFHLRDNLRNLTDCIENDGYDIETFNLYVTTQVEQLSARGEKSTDLIIYLFSAYLSVPDNKFTDYIERQKDKLDEGDIISPKKLMQLALNKYKERKQANKCCTPSYEEQKLMALTAEIRESRNKSIIKEKKCKRDFQDVKKKSSKYAWKLTPPGIGEPSTKVVNHKRGG